MREQKAKSIHEISLRFLEAFAFRMAWHEPDACRGAPASQRDARHLAEECPCAA
jgi:hypothetical protein